jgi:hypothetical protein
MRQGEIKRVLQSGIERPIRIHKRVSDTAEVLGEGGLKIGQGSDGHDGKDEEGALRLANREASSEGGETCWRIEDGREDASTL